MKNITTISLIPTIAEGIHPQKCKPNPRISAPSAPMEAIDNNRFFYGSQ
jgi:hypothetical protein